MGQQHLDGHAVVDERLVAAEQFPRAGLKTQNPVLHETKHRQCGKGLGTAGQGEDGVVGVRYGQRAVGQTVGLAEGDLPSAVDSDYAAEDLLPCHSINSCERDHDFG